MTTFKKLLLPFTAVLVLVWAGLVLGQGNSPGGAFDPGRNMRLSGVFTWRATLSPIIIEGVTDDAFETTLTFAEPTADRTFTFPDAASGTFVFSSLATNGIDVANSIWGASNGLVFEGATADAFETTVSPTNVGGDITLTLPGLGNASGAVLASTLTTNDLGIANSVWGVSNGITFEGATADAGELFLTVADVATASRTMTLPDMGAASAVLASTLTTNTVGAANSVWGVSNGMTFEGATADAGELFLTVADIATASRTMTLPDMAAASAVLASTLTTNAAEIVNSIWGVSNGLTFEGATADGFEATLTVDDPSVADATFSLPNAQGISAGVVVMAGCSFTEDAASTTHTCTIELPAGSVLLDIWVTSTVLWGDADAGLVVGDDDSANGYFTDTDLSTTSLVVGERLQANGEGAWGAVNGAYLTTAGRIGPAAATDSGGYRTVAAEVIGVVSVATPSATAGRTFMFVSYVTPAIFTATAS